MRKGMAFLACAGCVLWAASMATAQTEAELKTKVDSLEKKVAFLEKAQAGNVETMKAEETRKVAKEIATDSTQYASDFKIVWNDGVWFKSSDDKFALHAGGRLMMDWGWTRTGISGDRPSVGQGFDFQDRSLPVHFRDGAEMRSLRLMLEGTLFTYVKFKVEVDFHQEDDWDLMHHLGGAVGSDAVLKDVYMELTKLPLVGNIRVGHFKEPFGLESQTDDLFLTFMERSTMDTLVPGYNFGAMAHDAILGKPGEHRMTWAVGVFRAEGLGNAIESGSGPVLHTTDDNVDGTPVHSDRGYSVTARVTALPYYENKGEKLIHLGVSYSYRKSDDNHFARFVVRPESHSFEWPLLDVSITNARDMNLFGAEAALVYGPFSLQAEYVGASIGNDGPWEAPPEDGVTTRADAHVCYNAFYTQASYFLTGEHRAYNTETGSFDRVRPKKNFREDGGWGAFELAGRVSYISLDQQQLTTFGLEIPNPSGGYGYQTYASRGELTTGTVGVNWYLNPNTKVSANYIHACPKRIDTESSADIFMMRFQVDF